MLWQIHNTSLNIKFCNSYTIELYNMNKIWSLFTAYLLTAGKHKFNWCWNYVELNLKRFSALLAQKGIHCLFFSYIGLYIRNNSQHPEYHCADSKGYEQNTNKHNLEMACSRRHVCHDRVYTILLLSVYIFSRYCIFYV